jgi:hypothetical protein
MALLSGDVCPSAAGKSVRRESPVKIIGRRFIKRKPGRRHMVFRKPQELDIPPKAKADPDSREVLRMWMGTEGQHVCLRHIIDNDPAAWGLMLVDIARHVANAYNQQGIKPYDEVLARIKWGFDVEWRNPTERARGSIR